MESHMTAELDCARIGCTKPVSYDRPLCYPHWTKFDSLFLYECAKCHRFDDVLHEVDHSDDDHCFDCARGDEVPVHIHAPVEHIERYLYVLKLDGGRYYIGQTNDLELRVKEHQDGLTKSTAGKNPRLAFFQKWTLGKEFLDEYEEDLTLLNKSNPRAIRRGVTEWQRLIRLVHVE